MCQVEVLCSVNGNGMEQGRGDAGSLIALARAGQRASIMLEAADALSPRSARLTRERLLKGRERARQWRAQSGTLQACVRATGEGSMPSDDGLCVVSLSAWTGASRAGLQRCRLQRALRVEAWASVGSSNDGQWSVSVYDLQVCNRCVCLRCNCCSTVWMCVVERSSP